ncbi:hypothetical protein [Streptomyces sp. HUAS TT7]
MTGPCARNLRPARPTLPRLHRRGQAEGVGTGRPYELWITLN